MSKKFQVFISSTYNDLTEERRAATQSVLDLGHIPSGMELFPAFDAAQFEYIKQMIDDTDFYIVIVAARYGSCDVDGVGFTEKEYDYANTTGKTVLAFIHDKPEDIAASKWELDENTRKKLNLFKEKLKLGRLVKFWNNVDGLTSAITTAIAVSIAQTKQPGWVRGDRAASEDLLQQINDLRVENDRLKSALLQLQSVQPQISDIAPLSQQQSLHFEYEADSRSAKRNLAIDMSWAEIFAAVGPNIYKPSSVGMVSVAIKSFLSERRRISYWRWSLHDSDEHLIKIQLEALGLVQSYNANSVGGGVGEFITITEGGKRVLSELMVVRQQQAQPGL